MNFKTYFVLNYQPISTKMQMAEEKKKYKDFNTERFSIDLIQHQNFQEKTKPFHACNN